MLCQVLRILWNFEIFHDRLGPGLRDDITTNSLSISAIGLKFGGMMHSNMKQIVIWNGHAWPIFVHSSELWNFQNMLRPGLRDDVTSLTLSKDCSYWPEIRWDDAQCNETDRYLKWPYSRSTSMELF